MSQIDQYHEEKGRNKLFSPFSLVSLISFSQIDGPNQPDRPDRPNEPNRPKKYWYVIQTKANQEEKVIFYLNQRGIRAYLPKKKNRPLSWLYLCPLHKG